MKEKTQSSNWKTIATKNVWHYVRIYIDKPLHGFNPFCSNVPIYVNAFIEINGNINTKWV